MWQGASATVHGGKTLLTPANYKQGRAGFVAFHVERSISSSVSQYYHITPLRYEYISLIYKYEVV